MRPIAESSGMLYILGKQGRRMVLPFDRGGRVG